MAHSRCVGELPAVHVSEALILFPIDAGFSDIHSVYRYREGLFPSGSAARFFGMVPWSAKIYGSFPVDPYFLISLGQELRA